MFEYISVKDAASKWNISEKGAFKNYVKVAG